MVVPELKGSPPLMRSTTKKSAADCGRMWNLTRSKATVVEQTTVCTEKINRIPRKNKNNIFEWTRNILKTFLYKIDSNPGRTQCIAQDQDVDDMGMEHTHTSSSAAQTDEDFELGANSQMDLFLQHQKFHGDKPDVDGTQTHDNFHSAMDRALVDLERRLEEPKEATPDF